MRNVGDAHARGREVVDAAFYTHVATVAKPCDDAATENRDDEFALDWKRSLIPITLPRIEHRKSSKFYHPNDPRRKRQLERQQNEFAEKWRTVFEIDECDGAQKSDQYAGCGRLGWPVNFHGNMTTADESKEVEGEKKNLVATGENGNESLVMSRIEVGGKEGSSEQEDNWRRNPDDPTRRSSVPVIEERSSSSEPTKPKRILPRDGGSPEAVSALSTVVEEDESVVTNRSKVTSDDSRLSDVTELLDDRVGNGCRFLIGSQRTTITLNLNSRNSDKNGTAKKDTTKSSPSTEIRLAESSVPDVASNGKEEHIVPVKKFLDATKPKIVEDLTCLEGTILSTASLKKFAESKLTTMKRKTTEVDEKLMGGDGEAPRKIRRFGKVASESESYEEKSIVNRASSQRRNGSRMSSDSGVCLNEHGSDNVCSGTLEKQRVDKNPEDCPRAKLGKNTKKHHRESIKENFEKHLRKNRGKFARRNPKANPRRYTGKWSGKFPRKDSFGKFKYSGKNLTGKPREFWSDERMKNSIRKSTESRSLESGKISSVKKRETKVEKADALSMPLLDCEYSDEEVRDEPLPDSSTRPLKKIVPQSDSNSGDKLAILVTSLNFQDRDFSDSLTLYFDQSEEAQNSTPTSTTSNNIDDDDSCQIVDQIIIKKDLSLKTETKSCDNDRIIKVEDWEPETDQTPIQRAGWEESNQRIPDGINSSEKNSPNSTDVVGSSLTIKKIIEPEVDPGEAIKISDETLLETVGLKSESKPDRLKLNDDVLLTCPGDDKTKLSELTSDDSLTGERPSMSAALRVELAKVPSNDGRKSNDNELPDSETPRCIPDAQKPNDVPKMPNFRILHPSELGSRWCPTPLATEARQSQPPVFSNATIAQPGLVHSPPMAQPQFTPSPSIAQSKLINNPTMLRPPLYHLFPQYLNSQILRHPAYPQIRQAPPETLIQTPPSSPLQQMQQLVTQTPTSALGLENLSVKNSLSSSKPRTSQTDIPTNFLTPSSSPNRESPLGKQQFIMNRILNSLIFLASIVERVKRESDMEKVLQVNKDYVAERAWLFNELDQYACTHRIKDLRTLVTSIMAYYDNIVPYQRRSLRVEVVYNILNMKTATMASPLYAKSPLLTDSQREMLFNQISIYRCLTTISMYQLLAQRRVKETTKKTRQRKPRAPDGQNQAVPAPSAEGCEPIIETNQNCQTNIQIQRVDGNVQNQTTDINVQGQNVDKIVQNQGMERDVQGQTCDDTFQGHTIVLNDDVQTIETSVPGQDTEKGIQGQIIADVEEQTNEENTSGQAIEKSDQFDIIEVDACDEKITDKLQSRTIVKEDSLVDSALNENSSSPKDDNVSVVDLLDEEEMFDGEIVEECIDLTEDMNDCFQCGISSTFVCKQCRLASYCSVECHQKHWHKIHYKTCKPPLQETIE